MKLEGYLGLDVGGTGAKAGVVDERGRLLGISQRPYRPQLTEDGYSEIPIDTVYSAAREAAVSAIAESGARVVALSISSQGQTFVSLDDHDEPLHSAIVWYDARAAEQANRLTQALQSGHLQGAMPFVTPIATGPKIMWLHEHLPARMAPAKRYLLLPDYLAYRLTGRAVTDPSTAASTALYAEDAADYCPAALTAAGISKGAVAEIQKSGQPIARVLPKSAPPWGLDSETLVVTGTNDQYAGALGAGNCRPGIVSVTTGTCLALVTLTEHLPQPMPPGLLGGRFPIPRYQFALAFSKTAGVVLEWFNRELSPDRNLRDLDDMASHVPIGSRGVTMLPYFDGMISPVPDPDARGGFLNLSLHHTRADMYRATLEGLGYTLHENLEFFRRCGFDVNIVRAIGGGAKSDFWLQMIADITGLSIERPMVAEAAVLGAAMIAAVGSGAFSSLEECSEAFYKRERVFAPHPGNHALYEKLCKNYIRLYRHTYHHREQPNGS
jgi:xylulokinase